MEFVLQANYGADLQNPEVFDRGTAHEMRLLNSFARYFPVTNPLNADHAVETSAHSLSEVPH